MKKLWRSRGDDNYGEEPIAKMTNQMLEGNQIKEQQYQIWFIINYMYILLLVTDNKCFNTETEMGNGKTVMVVVSKGGWTKTNDTVHTHVNPINLLSSGPTSQSQPTTFT